MLLFSLVNASTSNPPKFHNPPNDSDAPPLPLVPPWVAPPPPVAEEEDASVVLEGVPAFDPGALLEPPAVLLDASTLTLLLLFDDEDVGAPAVEVVRLIPHNTAEGLSNS